MSRSIQGHEEVVEAFRSACQHNDDLRDLAGLGLDTIWAFPEKGVPLVYPQAKRIPLKGPPEKGRRKPSCQRAPSRGRKHAPSYDMHRRSNSGALRIRTGFSELF